MAIDVACIGCLDSDFKAVELYSSVLRWSPRILLGTCIGKFGFSLFFFLGRLGVSE